MRTNRAHNCLLVKRDGGGFPSCALRLYMPGKPRFIAHISFIKVAVVRTIHSWIYVKVVQCVCVRI